MNCPRCGAPSNVLETRQNKRAMTTTRGRVCFNNHRFKTIEVHEPVYCSAKQRNATFVQTALKRIALYKRDVQIAKNLGAVGWEHLADKFQITKSAVYYAAKKGQEWLTHQLPKKGP